MTGPTFIGRPSAKGIGRPVRVTEEFRMAPRQHLRMCFVHASQLYFLCTFQATRVDNLHALLYYRQPSLRCFLSLPSIRTPVVATQRCVLAYTHSMNRGDKRPLNMNGEDAAIGDKRQRGLVARCSTLRPEASISCAVPSLRRV